MKVLFPYEVVYEMIRINSMYSVGLGSVPSLLTDHLELQHNANFEQQIVQNKWLFFSTYPLGCVLSSGYLCSKQQNLRSHV